MNSQARPDEAVLRYCVNNRLNAFEIPADDVVHPLRFETGCITCRCGNRIQVIAELAEAESELRIWKYARRYLDSAFEMLGEADEFFETLCGRSYLESKYKSEIRAWHRFLEKLREKIARLDEEAER